jgi:hypothetical protein
MTGFKSAWNAGITIAEFELAHRIKKRQFSFGRYHRTRKWSLKQLWTRALT